MRRREFIVNFKDKEETIIVEGQRVKDASGILILFVGQDVKALCDWLDMWDSQYQIKEIFS